MVPLYERTRGGRTESLHFGAFAVVDSHGNLLAGRGDPQLTTFLRSSAKPIQALPFVEAGGIAHFRLTRKELAVMCASHTGSLAHTDTVGTAQARVGLLESDLQCGAHMPHDKSAADQLKASGRSPTPNHNNCSGKHTGMLAFAGLNGWPLESYLEPAHPVQQRILAVLSDLSGVAVEAIETGIDGCSAPNFALPLYNSALAFARMADPSGLPPEQARACSMVLKAMTSNPVMIAGPGEFDTRLMETAQGTIFSKGGAEGYQVAGILPGAISESSPGCGIAIKVSDGDPGGKVRAAVLLQILAENGILRDDQLEDLAEFGPEKTLRNVRGTAIGRAGPVSEPGDYPFSEASTMEAHGSR